MRQHTRSAVAGAAAFLFLLEGDLTAQGSNGPRTAYVFAASHLDITFTGHPPLAYARAHRIFDAALDLARKQPNFRFVIENQYFLAEYLRTHPEQREPLAAAVRAGKFEISAQWASMLQNPFTGEDLVRNVLYATEFARRELGAAPGPQSLSDAPGQTGQLPQILASAGIPGVLITRAGPTDAHLFEWEGLDGSRIRAANMPAGYVGGYLMGMGESLEAMEGSKSAEFELSDISPEIMTNRVKQPAGLLPFLQFVVPKGLDRALIEVSWDNMMPPERLAANIETWNARHGEKLKLVSSLPREFFTDHWPSKAPLKTGEIPSVWFNGGWSIVGGYQKHMGTSHRLLQAEKWSTVAHAVLGTSYPAEEMRRAWHQHLITLDHEGHDLVPQADEAAAAAVRVSGEARQALASHVRIPGPMDIALVVFNPLNWPRTETVTAEVNLVGDPFAFFTRPYHKLQLLDLNEKPVPFEIASSKSTIIRMIQVRFRAEDVPPLGWKTYYLRPAQSDGSQRYGSPVEESGNAAAASGSGGVEFERKGGALVLRSAQFRDAARLRYYHQPEATSSSPGFFRQRDSGAPVEVNWKRALKGENSGGPFLRLEGSVAGAALTLEVQPDPAGRIEVREQIGWRGGKPLKLVREMRFDGNGEFVYGTPFGERRLDCLMPGAGPQKEGSFDELGRTDWEASREHDGWLAWQRKGHRISVAGEGRGSRFGKHAVKTTLLYSDGSVPAPASPGAPAGEFRSHLVVAFHAEAEGSTRLGWEAQNPLEATVSVGRLSGRLPAEFAAVQHSPRVVVSAVKVSESGRGIVARAYSPGDGEAFPELLLKGWKPAPANVLESGRTGPHRGAMRRWEIRTVLLSRGAAARRDAGVGNPTTEIRARRRFALDSE